MKIIEKTVKIEGYSFLNLFYGRIEHVPSHNVTYLECGDPQNENIIFCAHGLTRNAHDFDVIAQELGKNFRVISINYPGRDTSDYFTDKKHYNYPVYFQETEFFFKKLNLKTENIIWLGTSMGGIIGMYHSHKNKFKALILNDVGSFISSDSLNHLKKDISSSPVFENLIDAKNYLKSTYDVGNITEEKWDCLTKHSVKRHTNGLYYVNYDARMIDNIPNANIDLDLSMLWINIPCSILVVHGARSRILDAQSIATMRKSKKMNLLEIEDAGHAPSLMVESQINFIKNWIENLPASSNTVNRHPTPVGIIWNDMFMRTWGKHYNKVMNFYNKLV